MRTASTGEESLAYPIGLVLAAVCSVQVGAAVGTTLVHDVGPGRAVTLRLAFAAAVMWLVARPRLRGRSAADWRAVLAYGTALGLMNLCFYASLTRLPIAVATTLEFVGPLVLAAALSRRARDAAAVVCAAAGVVLISQVLGVPVAELPMSSFGLALAAGAMWAAYIVTSQAVGRRFARVDGLAIAMTVALGLAVPFAGVVGVADGVDGGALVRGALAAVLSSVLPYSLELLALRRLSAHVFGVLLSLQPAVAAGAGWLVLRQTLTPVQGVGMVAVIVASVLVVARPKPSPAVPQG